MEGAPQSYFDRLDAGIGFRWPELPERVFTAGAVDPGADTVRLHRKGNSHRGIGAFRNVRTLMAYQVDAAFLEELCELGKLECLYMESVRASDLRPLGRLRSLRQLIINGATQLGDLDWVGALSPEVFALAVEHAPKVRRLDPLAGLSQLKTLAIEGSLDTSMRVETLARLAGLRGLESLFLTGLKTQDRRLAPLAGLTGLKVLEFGNYYAAGEIEALAIALPNTRCSWFKNRVAES